MADTETATVLFCDLVDSTLLLSRVGDDRGDEVRRAVFDALRGALAVHGGSEVKSLGDGLMAVFPRSVVDGLSCAIAMQRAVAAISIAGVPELRLRVGISTGEIVLDDGDWFGTPVVEAARLCAAAYPSAILVAGHAARVAGTRGGHRYRQVGELHLKGLAPLPTVALLWRDGETPEPGPFVIRVALPRRWRSRRAMVALVAAVVIVAAGIVVVAVDRASDEATSSIAFAKPVGYHPRYLQKTCSAEVRSRDATARCGELVVPESRSKPNGPTLRLGVTIYPARVDRASDPIVQVSGDFGVPEEAGDTLLRRRRDSIQLAARGFVGSNPRLSCPEVSDAIRRALGRPMLDPQNTIEYANAVTSCRDHWVAQGVDLSTYSWEESATDVRDLAVALHLEHINVQAGGPQVILARDIAGRYPGLVRSILLSSVIPPNGNRWNGAISNARAALNRYFEECADQPACTSRFGDLAAKLRSDLATSQASPVTVMVTDPSDLTRRFPVVLDGYRIVRIVVSLMRSSEALPLLTAGFADADAQTVVDAGIESLVFPDDASWGAVFSRACIDEIGTFSKVGVGVERNLNPDFAFATDAVLNDVDASVVCDLWPTQPVAHHASSPVATPTLILLADLNPRSSSDWANATARSFGDAVVVRLPHIGNELNSSSQCVQDVRQHFIEQPERRVDPSVCEGRIPLIHFAGL